MVDYYRCDVCGHVWHHAKSSPESPAVRVTEPPATLSKRKKPEPLLGSRAGPTVQFVGNWAPACEGRPVGHAVQSGTDGRARHAL